MSVHQGTHTIHAHFGLWEDTEENQDALCRDKGPKLDPKPGPSCWKATGITTTITPVLSLVRQLDVFSTAGLPVLSQVNSEVFNIQDVESLPIWAIEHISCLAAIVLCIRNWSCENKYMGSHHILHINTIFNDRRKQLSFPELHLNARKTILMAWCWTVRLSGSYWHEDFAHVQNEHAQMLTYCVSVQI